MTENVRTPLLPIFITLITLPIGFGFQTYQLFQEQNNLSALSANQEVVFKNSQKMHAQLDALASGTSKLALQGNPNAQQIVSALAQRGIAMNSNEGSKAPAK